MCSKIGISNLFVNSVMLHVSCVIIIEAPATLFEHDSGALVKVQVDGCV